MNNINSLSHSKWECKYHVVWIPKCRRKPLFGQLRKYLGEVFHDLARQKESKILEGRGLPPFLNHETSIFKWNLLLFFTAIDTKIRHSC